jgi:hypothetical protein
MNGRNINLVNTYRLFSWHSSLKSPDRDTFFARFQPGGREHATSVMP